MSYGDVKPLYGGAGGRDRSGCATRCATPSQLKARLPLGQHAPWIPRNSVCGMSLTFTTTQDAILGARVVEVLLTLVANASPREIQVSAYLGHQDVLWTP